MVSYLILSFLEILRKTTPFVVKFSKKNSGSLKSETFSAVGRKTFDTFIWSYFHLEKATDK